VEGSMRNVGHVSMNENGKIEMEKWLQSRQHICEGRNCSPVHERNW